MKLYLLRHGPAREKAAWAPRPDSARPLTAAGERRVKKVSKSIRRQGLSFDLILTSPYERALRTARILAKTLHQKDRITPFSPLTPSGSLKEVVRALARRAKRSPSILLVGHEPSLSRLLSILTTGRPSSSFVIKKAGLAMLEMTRPRYGRCATLQFLATPQQIS